MFCFYVKTGQKACAIRNQSSPFVQRCVISEVNSQRRSHTCVCIRKSLHYSTPIKYIAVLHTFSTWPVLTEHYVSWEILPLPQQVVDQCQLYYSAILLLSSPTYKENDNNSVDHKTLRGEGEGVGDGILQRF